MKRIIGSLLVLGLAGCAGGGGSTSAPAPTVQPQASAVVSELAVSFDGSAGQGFSITTQFDAPDFVPGVAGQAWRTDGFSSFGRGSIDLSDASGFTASTWVAIESYPSDLEVPVRDLSPSSIMNQRGGGDGFDIFIDTYGRWGLWVATSRGRVTVDAPEPFPLYNWAHVAARLDPQTGTASLFLDGEEVASERLSSGATFRPEQTDLLVARAVEEVSIIDTFTINRLNASYDALQVTGEALSDGVIRSAYQKHAADLPDWTASLAVPADRFASDYHRPQFRGMPPSGWTNEPHGLTFVDGTWHMFYQRTPNGPFKTQMHWGHMVSDDLVTWRHEKDALWPELQDDSFGFDQKGIWSGDVIVDGDMAFAFYTSVNHSDRLQASNPGIAMATSPRSDMVDWEKSGPIINTRYVNDFRDPYLFRSGGTWHMIIGAAVSSGGGLDYWVLEQTANGANWDHREDFASTSYGQMDVGSIIWEMPVFEPLTDDVWVLTVAPIGGQVSKYGSNATRNVYWTGRWNGSQFQPFSAQPTDLDILPGHLAPTVDRAADGTLRAIGIVDERRSPQSQEDAGWAHTYSLPRRWFLMPDGRTMGQAPAPEVAALRGAPQALAGAGALSAAGLDVGDAGQAYELEIELASGLSSAALVVDLLADPSGAEVTQLRFDAVAGTVTLDKSRSTLDGANEEGPRTLTGAYDTAAFGPIETVRLFVDGSVVDVFINDAAAFAFRAYPTRADATQVRISAEGDPVTLQSVTHWPLVGAD
ncbi:MAG: GH32 C-terminal domain-containing protein [Pseudomonadota bacterium]